jgi:hypothetical protein
MLEEALALLPTPTATPYGNNQSPSAGAAVRPSLDGLVKLLPTPLALDAEKQSKVYGRGNPTLRGVCLSSGETSDQPSDAGRPSTGLRLSPWFVEWMIGAPAGWSDPDCPLSATEFKSRSESSSAATSSTSSASDSKAS